MRPAIQFTRRVIRTERSALIQITCVQCGFTTVGVKERIQIIENEHPSSCKGHSPRREMESAMEASSVPAILSLTINRQATTDAIIRCTGRITSETTQSLKATVKPLISESERVVLDLTDVNYVDSSGLGVIVGLYISAKFANCHLKVIYSNETLKKLFSIARLDQLLAEGA